MAANFLIYSLRGDRLDHWDPWGFLASLGAGIVALVGVSLLTGPEPEEKQASFYGRLQTSTDPGLDSSQEAAEAGQQSLLVNLLHPFRGTAGVGVLRAYREDPKGCAIGWVAAVLVIGTWLLMGE